VRRAGLARDVLHERDGALAHERDGHGVGAYTVAGGAGGGVGGTETGRGEHSMTDWGRVEFLPGWAGARIRRRQAREARIEWASRDGIFFAALVATAHEAWFLVLLATV